LDADPLCGTPAGATNNDLSGEPTLYASDYSASVFFDYNAMMTNDLEFFAGGEMNYRDDFNSAGDNDPIDVIDGYTKFNIRLGIRGEHWEAMFYGRNIFDKVAYAQSFDTPVLAGSHTSFVEEGEVWGARLKYMF
jgi:outer membrane receptor protein involved in Fe transport